MTTRYIDIPEELRQVDQSLRTLRQILARLPVAYLLGDKEGVAEQLQSAITTTQHLAKHLQTAHDRSTRT